MNVDRSAIAAGAGVASAVAAAAVVGAQVVKSAGGANADAVLYVVLLAGLVAGGRVAARRQPRSPLTHGALAALCAYVALVSVITVVRLAVGHGVADPVSIVFNGLMAASAGIFGGYLVARRGVGA